VKPATLHADAEAELWEALDYYERQRTGLGGEFRRCSAWARIPKPMRPKTIPESGTARCVGSPTAWSMWS
jgi:hypothetical protein